MLTSVCLGTNDLTKAQVFYDAVLATLGMERVVTEPHELGYGPAGGEPAIWIVVPYDKQPATRGNGTQVIFNATGPEMVQAFHASILAHGGSDEGPPGPRDYATGYYGAYGRDLDGNKLHASCITA